MFRSLLIVAVCSAFVGGLFPIGPGNNAFAQLESLSFNAFYDLQVRAGSPNDGSLVEDGDSDSVTRGDLPIVNTESGVIGNPVGVKVEGPVFGETVSAEAQIFWLITPTSGYAVGILSDTGECAAFEDYLGRMALACGSGTIGAQAGFSFTAAEDLRLNLHRQGFTNFNSYVDLNAGQVWEFGSDNYGYYIGGNRDYSTSFTVMWSVNDAPYVGTSPNAPVPPSGPDTVSDPNKINDTIQDNAQDEDDSYERADNITGIDLTTPFLSPVVEGGYGHTEPIYFDPALAIGYGYIGNGDTRFTSFEISDALPQGDALFEVHHAGVAYPLAAGETFDFTALDPNGVDSFLLLGIDETELIDAGDSNPPFVFGMTFANPGVASFESFAIVRVPEPSSLALVVLCFSPVLGRRVQKPPRYS